MRRFILAVALAPIILFSVQRPIDAAPQTETLHVPQDYATIQAAIDAATPGGTVMASPGVYRENIDFKGKSITIKSAHGPRRTVIDGGGLAPVASFRTNEGPDSELRGFTLRNGTSTHGGGGVEIQFASPTISANIITSNSGCRGAGINISFGSPVVEHNIIRDNTLMCTGGGPGGGGITVGGYSRAVIRGNWVKSNKALNAPGGGITLYAAVDVVVSENLIEDNEAFSGGGLWIINASNALVLQNVIIHNKATDGGGVYLGGASSPTFVNNTIADNSAPWGSSLFNEGRSGPLLVNNILSGSEGQPAIYCGFGPGHEPPTLQFNNIFSPHAPPVEGCSSDPTGHDGNISADPRFVGPARGHFRLRRGSPSIDAGTNAAPSLPPFDFWGRPRLMDGDGDGSAVVDQGAFETPGSRRSRDWHRSEANMVGRRARPALGQGDNPSAPCLPGLGWGLRLELTAAPCERRRPTF